MPRRAALGIPVIPVWFVVKRGALGLTLDCRLVAGTVEAKAVVRASWSWGAVAGLEPQPGGHAVTKMRMLAIEGAPLEIVLRAKAGDIRVHDAWTNMAIEHTGRTGADRGSIVVSEDGCATMNADWHRACVKDALRNIVGIRKTSEAIAALGGPRA